MIPTSTNATVSLVTAVPAKADAIALLVPRGVKPQATLLADADRSALSALQAAQALPKRANETITQVVAEPAAHRLILVGLGDAEKVSAQSLREAAAAVARAARRLKLKSVAIIVPDVLKAGGPEESPEAAAVDALVTGVMLGNYQFRECKGSADKDDSGAAEKSTASPGLAVSLVLPRIPPEAKKSFNLAKIVADGQNLARTIASRPGNEINPPTLAAVAQQVARAAGLVCKVLDEKQLKKLGMGGLLAVGAGSATPPRLIVLEHRGAPANRRQKPIVLVGKSITFDTGGVSIKPAEHMGDMVYDKCGGMTVLGTMYALAKSRYPRPVVGILTSAENHLPGTAYRPGDIITLFNGVTVEVTNTDAEGRLVLADALAWGIKTYKPEAIIDLATLTGGCVVALGHTIAALMSNDDALAQKLLEAAQQAGEKAWRMPVTDDHRDMIKGHHSDIVNSAGRWASPLTGAAFLTFALPEWNGDKPDQKVPWAHFDIAGVADTDKELPLYARGATGWGVRTLIRFLRQRTGAQA